MQEKTVPYGRVIFVCTNVRADGRIACANVGRDGVELCEKLKAAVKEKGLKGRVRVARSGCLDVCEQGPNIFIFPDNVWLQGTSREDLSQIIASYLEPLVNRL